jgi:adiponectin receptor
MTNKGEEMKAKAHTMELRLRVPKVEEKPTRRMSIKFSTTEASENMYNASEAMFSASVEARDAMDKMMHNTQERMYTAGTDAKMSMDKMLKETSEAIHNAGQEAREKMIHASNEAREKMIHASNEAREKMMSASHEAREKMKYARTEAEKMVRVWYYTFEQCPEYLQDNEYITRGYRAFYSYQEAWKSLFDIHNQTGNIWTHIFGFFIMLFLIYFVWNDPVHPSMNLEDKVIQTIFLALACYTFVFSSMFHLHQCVSHSAETFWACLDFSGISASIAGGSVAVMYLLLHWYLYFNAVIQQ